MNKSDSFSIARLWRMIILTITENRRSILLQLGVMIGITAVLVAFTIVNNGSDIYVRRAQQALSIDTDLSWSNLWGLYCLTLTGFSCISASFTAGFMSSKEKRLNTLMIPATAAEKFLARWIIYTLSVYVLFTLTYICIDYLRVLILNYIYADVNHTPILPLVQSIPHYYNKYSDFNPFHVIPPIIFAVQSFFVLGSTIWPKNSFIKTFVIGGAATLCVIFITVAYAHKLTFGYFDLNEHTSPILFINLIAAFTFLYTTILAYFRFRSSEIILKW